jgi:hypothetical protein
MQEMMKTNQEKADADREHMQEMMAKIETDREEMMTRMDTNQERMNASLRERIQSGKAEKRSIVSAWIANMRDGRKGTMSGQVTAEACLDSKELDPEGMESKVEHREVPMEEAAVKSSGTMKKRHKGWHLAAG